MRLGSGRGAADFRWRAVADSGSAGLATIRVPEGVASMSLLVTGLEPAADEAVVSVLQTHLARELHDTGYEAAFELETLRQRPLLATLTLRSPPEESARLLVAIADRCFAAAYFRYHRLA